MNLEQQCSETTDGRSKTPRIVMQLEVLRKKTVKGIAELNKYISTSSG